MKKARQQSVMVRNENVDANWKLKNNENWIQIFRHKSKDAPVLSNGCKACLKYHVKGFCFDDCKFKNAHIQLEGEDYEKNHSFMHPQVLLIAFDLQRLTHKISKIKLLIYMNVSKRKTQNDIRI